MIVLIVILGIMIVGIHLAYGSTPRVAAAPVKAEHRLHNWVYRADEKLVCDVCGLCPAVETNEGNY